VTERQRSLRPDDADWRDAVEEWVRAGLAQHDVRLTGPVEDVRDYPWAVVMRWPTDQGPVWFKANARGTRHEVPLYDVLARRAPEHVLTPLATDVERSWLLLPHGGPTLRSIEGAGADLGLWERMLVEYAQLQREVAPYADELLAAGMVDASPQALPAIRAALLDQPDLLLMGKENGLTPEQRAELIAGQDEYARRCAVLAELGPAPTLQHDDLHDNNVFLPAEEGGALRVFDWGDAVVGHPFGTLLISLRVVSDRAQLPADAPELLRLRDAYLDAWSGEMTRADLEEAARHAVWVDCVSRADCYRRALLEAVGEERAGQESGVPGWLLEERGPMPL
jgi:hypothetical protein